MSFIADILSFSLSQGLESVKEHHIKAIKRKTLFNEQLESLKIEGAYDVNRLKAYVFDREDRLRRFNASELSILFRAFRTVGAWQSMLELYDRASNQSFRSSTIIQESYAVALNKSGQFDKTIQFCNALISEGVKNGEVYGALAKAYLEKGDTATSIKYYEKGFLLNFETYPGINVAYKSIELGDIKRAKQVAQMLRLSSLRDGIQDSQDYWVLAIDLEASVILGEPLSVINSLIERISKLPPHTIEPWMYDSSIGAMKRAQSFLDIESEEYKTFEQGIQKMNSSKKRLEFNTAKSVDIKNECKPNANSVERSLIENSFSYRGLASNFVGQNFISGNYAFGGQLPDHCVNRTDIEHFEDLLSAPLNKVLPDYKDKEGKSYLSLNDIDDVDVFLKAVDVLIRRAFNNEALELEDLNSIGHKHYDEMVQNLLSLGGLSQENDTVSTDTRMNISVCMALGLGDCRHHAQAKQILFDVWQRRKMNTHLHHAYAALKDNDTIGFKSAVRAFKNIERYELRTFDMIVKAPIEMQEKYKPVYSKNKNPMASQDGSFNEVEDHTMNMLLRRDEAGNISKLEFADSFYHNHYTWASGDVPLEDIEINDGALILPAKNIAVKHDDLESLIQMPVKLTPTVYSGKRDKAANDEHGQMLLLGQKCISTVFKLSEHLKIAPSHRIKDLKGMLLKNAVTLSQNIKPSHNAPTKA